MARITILDTTLRDGQQSPGSSMTTSEKLRMAHELADLGVDVVEAGFATASAEDGASVRAIAREIEGPVVGALARSTPEDIDRAAELLAPSSRPRIHLFLPTSDVHLEHKVGLSRAACLDRAAASVTHARSLVDDVQFTAEDAMRADLDFLVEVVTTAVEAGATTVNLPDTVGYALPHEVARTVRALRDRVPGVDTCVLSTHCHDDLGLAVANALAAVEAGARQVECTINGIGPRAGNVPLEEVVMALAVRRAELGHETGVHTERLYRTSRLLTYLTGIEPQPNKAIVGRNAFTYAAGLQHPGVVDDPDGVSLMSPATVGAPVAEAAGETEAGRAGLEARYLALGYTLDPEELERVETAFAELADRKSSVLDEDLLSILHHGVMEDVPVVYRLSALDVRCGAGDSTATVEIEVTGEAPLRARGVGDGPIAAAMSALDDVLDFRVVLKDLTIRSATPGRDALGEVSIHALIDGHTFTGRGAHTDVVRASVAAYLHAVNKAAAARSLEEEHLAATADHWGV